MPQTVNIAFVAPTIAEARAAFIAQNDASGAPLPAPVKTALNTLLGTLVNTAELPGYAVAIWGHGTHFQITMKRVTAEEAAPAPIAPLPPVPSP